MEDLIKTLREQHWEISSVCDNLDKFCKEGVSAGADIERWMVEKQGLVFHLNKFKSLLIGHLKLEDNFLYPSLLKSKKKKTRETAKKFSEEMMQISEKAFSFFEKYAKLKVDELTTSNVFRDDLNLILTIIRKRINIEEVDLYVLYEQLDSKDKVSKNIFVFF